MRFHLCTYELARRVPRQDARASAGLAALAEHVRRLWGCDLPPSVREWYSLPGAVELLYVFSNEDRVLTPAEMLDELDARWARAGDWRADLVTERMLPLIWENQGVALWCLHLDGSDDPPVFVYDDDLHWRQCENSFSLFTAGWVWTHIAWADDLLLRAHDITLSVADHARIAAAFQPVAPVTACTRVKRYCREGADLLLYERTDTETYWCLTASSAPALLESARAIWTCGTLAQTLEIATSRARGEAHRVLETLRVALPAG